MSEDELDVFAPLGSDDGVVDIDGKDVDGLVESFCAIDFFANDMVVASVVSLELGLDPVDPLPSLSFLRK